VVAKKATPEEWAEYLTLYQSLAEQLAREPWFAAGWETRFDYLNPESPRGVWLQLVRKHWFDGAIHLETWIGNPALQSGQTPVVLHVETSIPNHGLSRNDFSKRLLEQVGEQVESWPGYTVKPNYAMEPFNVRVPFTKETLVPALKAAFSRLQQLGDVIDQTIEAVKR
jgi:hypothetical protein